MMMSRCVSASMSSTWRIFSYKELHAATNGFSEENKLGEGGFGSVYWGKTADGLQVRGRLGLVHIHTPLHGAHATPRRPCLSVLCLS
jgi:hypothetical protein